MKPHVADWQSRVYCLRIEPLSGTPVLLAGYPIPLVMSNGKTYLTEKGYEFSGMTNDSSFKSSSIDLEGIMQEGMISKEDLLAGLYDNARVYLFATSWTAPIEDEEPLGLLYWGKVEIGKDTYKVELMGAIDVLNQSVGRNYTYTCPWVFMDRNLGGELLPAGSSRCSGPRAAPDGPSYDALLITAPMTDITGVFHFAAVSGYPSDYFANGALRFITGKNAGMAPVFIRDSGGTYGPTGIDVGQSLLFTPEIGDIAEIIPGCRKRPEDCRDKWHNMINNGGFPDVPAPTQYKQVGRGA